ncbi:hypothetical protein F0562_030324 [Nyssa sinensis]|uniref:TF-B3 domain-containing protein n=1 Tax=Nyssa sinensis TaxID=561372 RepID=A0A5J5B2F8_9ASTE|nr:hypothetical protein F0562_030324 [Nyssa sinensis]
MEGGRIMEVCFYKKLSNSDINYALEIPGDAMNLLPPDEDMRVLDRNDNVWTFNAATRGRGARYMRKDWGRFKKFAGLKKDDRLTLFLLHNAGQNIHTYKMVYSHSSSSLSSSSSSFLYMYKMEGGMEVCFQKNISVADIKAALEIPRGANLPPPDEDMRVLDQNNREWTFNAGTRRDGRRHMRKGWHPFKNSAGLRRGDRLTFYRLHNNTYKVVIERNLRLFGRTWW